MIYVYARKGLEATVVAGVKIPVHSILCTAESIPEAGQKVNEMFNNNADVISKGDLFMIDATMPT